MLFVKRCFFCVCLAAALLATDRTSVAQVLTPVETFTLQGNVAQPDELSGIAGSGSPGGKVKSLGTLPSTHTLKPEGVCVLEETAAAWDILMLRDGEASIMRFRVDKNGQP